MTRRPQADPDDACGRGDEAVDQEQYLTFGLADEVFAVTVHQVREVLDLQPIARIANAPALLLGMIDVRGAGVPVIDLKGKLGIPARGGDTEHSRIVVLEVADGIQGQDFEPRPSYEVCSWCDYRVTCPASEA